MKRTLSMFLLLLACILSVPAQATNCTTDTATIQALLNGTTSPIVLPQGVFCITSYLTIKLKSSFIIKGAGGMSSTPQVGTLLQWGDGPGPAATPSATIPMFELLDSRELAFEDFSIEADDPLWAGFQSITDHRAVGYTVPPTGISWKRVVVKTNGPALTYGWHFKKGDLAPTTYAIQAQYIGIPANDWNNSEMTWWEGGSFGAKFGVYRGPTNAQAKAFRFYNSSFNCGSIAGSAGIGGRPDGTSATAGVSSLGVYGGNISYCDSAFDFGGPNDYIYIDNINSEGCGRALRTTQGWFTGQAVFSNSRFGFLGPLFVDNTDFIDFGYAGGPLVITGNIFDANYTKAGKIGIYTMPAGSAAFITGNVFRFTNGEPWHWTGGYTGYLQAFMNWIGPGPNPGVFLRRSASLEQFADSPRAPLMGRLIEDWIWAVLTIWQEARSQSYAGMRAVAEVIHNRMRLHYQSDGTVVGTVLRPWQFSGWNTRDPNRLMAARLSEDDPKLKACIAAWHSTERPLLPLDTVLYYNPAVVEKPPNWALPDKLVAVVEAHHFYRA